MRPLADLTPLDTQPAVWDQSTDDWNGIFANEFSGIDSQQAAADGESPALFAGMDPISSAIDGLSSALDIAGSVFDLLSGDLDTVNLDPVIQEYQGADAQLAGALDSYSLDFTSEGIIIAQQVFGICSFVVSTALQGIESILNFILGVLNNLSYLSDNHTVG